MYNNSSKSPKTNIVRKEETMNTQTYKTEEMYEKERRCIVQNIFIAREMRTISYENVDVELLNGSVKL